MDLRPERLYQVGRKEFEMKGINFGFHLVIFLLLLSGLAGCSGSAPGTALPGTATPVPTSEPTLSATPTLLPSPLPTSVPSPVPSPRAALSVTELKYKLIDELGNPFFCDPDVYPVARAISPQEFEQRVEAIQQNSEEFQAILLHNALAGKTTLTQDQKQIVYSEHKKLNSISLTPAGDGYRFSLRVAQNKASGFAIDGSIDFSGSVSITKKQATVITCPICLAGGTLIDTPDGPVEVEDLRVGMPVWTADRAGVRQPAIVMQTSQRAIAEGTLLIRLVLEDGRMLVVSEGHPAADGRAIGTYRVGQTLDGSRITEMELIPYAGTVTYDLLPSGETSLYWANGILLGSTLSLPEP